MTFEQFNEHFQIYISSGYVSDDGVNENYTKNAFIDVPVRMNFSPQNRRAYEDPIVEAHTQVLTQSLEL